MNAEFEHNAKGRDSLQSFGRVTGGRLSFAIRVVVLVGVLCLGWPGISAHRTEVIDRLMAVVNRQIITLGDVEQELKMQVVDPTAGVLAGVGYVMANVLKWYWWRFNGYGYFWGMFSGIISAMIIPAVTERILGHSINPLYTFPFIFGISVVGCLLGTFLTEPEDEEILKKFYKNVNPWGAWEPIREKVMQEDPAFVPNRNAGKDCANVGVGMVWQLCLTALPIYLVLKNWSWTGGILALLVVTSIFIKFNWYDKLEKNEVVAKGSQPEPAPTSR
jgi:hypothetical protein